MAQLDDINGPVMNEGRDVNVIAQKVPAKVGVGSKIFEICLWFFAIPGLVLLLMSLAGSLDIVWYVGLIILVIGLLPGIVYTLSKIKAGNYLLQLEQKIQHDASQIDNYLEQRVVILQNTAVLVEKAVNLDKSVFKDIAALRSGANLTDSERNDVAESLSSAERSIKVAFENYPQLQSHESIQKAMNENSYLQKEITAAREVYNDAVLRWNTEIFVWPCKKIVASSRGYTTRIPFATTKEVKTSARGVFFKEN